MNLKTTDRAVLKELIKEILREDLSLFKTALQEIIEEANAAEPEMKSNRQSKIEALVQEDFDNYEKIYKALA